MNKPTENNTANDIKAYLDAQGISYDPNARKADLLALLNEEDNESEEPADEHTEAPVDNEPHSDGEPVENSTEPERGTQEPETPSVQKTRFTKYELIVMSSFDGPTIDLLRLALNDDQLYTISEALAVKTAFAERMFY